MADITRRAAADGGVRPVRSDVQDTFVAGADFEAGEALYIEAATGNGVKSGGTYYGIVAKKAKTGLGVTAIRTGIFDGLDVSGLDFGAGVFTSATAGAVADATATGQSQIGFVIPGYGSRPADRLVFVDGVI